MRYSNKYISHKDSRGAVKFSNPELWVSPKGRRPGGETRVKQVSFQVFSVGCYRRTVSYLEGERSKEHGHSGRKNLKSVQSKVGM